MSNEEVGDYKYCVNSHKSYCVSRESIAKSCFNCANSSVDDDDILHCAEKNGKTVNDNDYCGKWN